MVSYKDWEEYGESEPKRGTKESLFFSYFCSFLQYLYIISIRGPQIQNPLFDTNFIKLQTNYGTNFKYST